MPNQPVSLKGKGADLFFGNYAPVESQRSRAGMGMPPLTANAGLADTSTSAPEARCPPARQRVPNQMQPVRSASHRRHLVRMPAHERAPGRLLVAPHPSLARRAWGRPHRADYAAPGAVPDRRLGAATPRSGPPPSAIQSSQPGLVGPPRHSPRPSTNKPG